MMHLAELVTHLRAHPGLHSKKSIQSAAKVFGSVTRCTWVDGAPEVRNGDDAAALPDGDGYLLFAGEGIAPELMVRDPWFAGFCSVMVNVNDIAAMGGVPYAVTDVLFAGTAVDNQRLLEGMRDASLAFGVPVVGGHTSQAPGETCLAVSIVGRARRLLSSFAAKPGHALVCAIDLRGAYRAPFNNFNAATSATSRVLRRNVALLGECANEGLALAAKDISQAGLPGTLVMLCESSGAGAELDLEALPVPAGVDLLRWLTTFPSFGYLLACEPRHVDALVQKFTNAGVCAAQVGGFAAQPQIALRRGPQREIYWDLSVESLTGLALENQRADEVSLERCGGTSKDQVQPAWSLRTDFSARANAESSTRRVC